MIRISIVLMAMAAMAVPAFAESIPRYDVPAYCQQVADVSGGPATIYNGCMQMEQEAYNTLKSGWPGVPAKMRTYCDEVARVSDGSYMILKGCLEMEAEVDSSTQDLKY